MDMNLTLKALSLAIAISLCAPVSAQDSAAAAGKKSQRAAVEQTPRDEFFWLGQINKASTVMTVEQGILPKAMAPRIAQGVAKVIADGAKPGAKRETAYIRVEPLLIEAAGPDVTRIHAGRSSQDMHSTYRQAMLRDEVLKVADSMDRVRDSLLKLAARNVDTMVPGYTNGVAAQPTSYAHYLLAYAAGFDRDAQRLREAYARLNRSPMGTAVYNTSSWPLNRDRMADLLGFDSPAENAYDASQISTIDAPVEIGSVVSGAALRVGAFIQDMMVQYAQPRPWILLEEGGDNTYVSSAMPQKRNPGILNGTRRQASDVIADAQGVMLRAHNLPLGMTDPKDITLNLRVLQTTATMFRQFNTILNGLQVNPQRALEELNSDWTASQELADSLMRKYDVPFRVGHHFASELVTYARANNILPLAFPYKEAVRIYAEAEQKYGLKGELPLTEQEFRAALDPVAIVKARVGSGGPQAPEVKRMLGLAQERVAKDREWTAAQREKLAKASRKLDAAFNQLLEPGAK